MSGWHTAVRCALLTVALICASGTSHASPSDTDPVLRAFRASDFAVVESELAKLFALRNGGHDESTLFDQAIERTAKAVDLDAALEPKLGAWAKAMPRSAHPELVRAAIALRRAWEVRGGGPAATVPDEAWPVFHARVREAEKHLEAGRRIDPRDLAIATLRIEIALLDSGDAQHVVARFEEALAIDPVSVKAHRAMLRALSPAWLGSHEGAIAFAREVAQRHPGAPSLGLLLLDAHLAAARDADSTPPGIARYVRRPAVWNELLPVLQRYVAAYPKDSWGHNRLAWLAWRAGQRAIVARELALIDGDYRDDAWEGECSPRAVMAWVHAPAPPAAARP